MRPTTALDGQSQAVSPLPHSRQHQYSGTDPVEGVYYGGLRGEVTQITDITTAVTLHADRGTITTVSQTVAAGAEAIFVVNNNLVQANDVVVVCLKSNPGNGQFLPYCSAVNDYSFTVCLTNLSTSAGNSILAINFAILHGQLS